MTDNRILSTLKSSNATLAVLVLALLAQTPHAADVFRLIVQSEGMAAIAHSYSFAIALELAVLLFVVQNRHTESYGFAAVSIAMNLSYYHLHGVHLIALAALPALLVSVALPVAIARYSHAVADVHGAQEPVVQDAEPDTLILPRAPNPEEVLHRVQDAIALELTVAHHMQQEAEAASRGELVLHDDSLHIMQQRVAALRSEGFDNKWIATQELREIAGTQLADVLGVNASTISRWRKAAQVVQS